MKVSVNSEQCVKIGRILSDYPLKPAFYKRDFITFDADRETKMRVYFLSVAICHQTRNLHHSGLNLWGWDFIEYGFMKLVSQRNPLLNPGYMSICSAKDISGLLAQTFSPTGKPEDCTLDRLEERSTIWLNICSHIKKNHQGSVSQMVDAAGGKLLNMGNGLYEKLAEIPAFSDPEKKKITFFIKLATDAGILNIKDTANMIPIMDYHMQRVLLRTGCVEVNDTGLRTQLIENTPMTSDQPVRGACIEAMKLISTESNLEIATMNDYFWPLGRSCCSKTTLCRDHVCAKDPCTLTQTIEAGQHNRCIFQGNCKAETDDSYLALWEPMIQTSFY